ncbi:nesprin-2-like isoform X2 [Pristis pectinata]|uniref:nesprin-2-like isoform X2 n=1 Tax=Pristis pectinata TaxID=685728 RepID=UPI00223CEBFA|nr:nesprin-2-like isoform X2 [Pristis pectinata]
MVEEALEADIPGNYGQLQERLEAHKVLQVEMALARQTLDAVDGERSPYPTAPGPHSDADTVTRISPGMSPELRCRIQRRGTELCVRASQWLRFSESWARLQQVLGSATARLRAMERLSRYSLGLLDQLQHEERSLRRHRSRYLHTLDLGGQLLSVADPQTQRVLQEQLGQLRESWESAGARVKDGAARLTHVQEMYSSCGEEAAVLGPKFQDLRKDLKRALPRSTEDLQREQGRLQELEQTLEHWACRLTELSSQTALLGAHLVPSAATGFQEQVTHLEDQCEQLRLASSVRRREISRGLDQWLLFNSRSKELGDWLKHMEDRVSQSTGTGTGIEEMIDRLQKDCIGEIALWERSRQAVQNLGEGLRDVSEPGRVSEIDSRLQHVHRRWQHLVQLVESRVKNLQETLASVHALDQEMSCLRSWLTHIEAELSKPLVYNACDDQEIERKLAEQQELQRDIDQHGAGVALVLHRCDGLLQDSDTDTECDSLQHQRRSLDRRWRSICAMSVERRMKIEETCRLWQKFLDDYARFEEWLQGAEETAAQPNTSHVPYSLAKEELKKYETFQRQTHESLTQLELINKQYRRLARENRTDTCSRLRHLVSEGNRRWDNLQRRIAAILRRLKHFTNQREEFESCREGILVWLTEMDLQLTNVEHFSESDITDKMRQLNAFQQEITLNTNKIDQLIVSGEHLIQKMEPLDAVDIEEELEELHTYCQEVFGRVARFHQRLTSKRPVCEDQDLRPPEPEDGERAGDTEGELPALTPAPPDGTSQQKSGRETPVSVDSIPLEWDHTVDVGGSSSHDEDDGLVYRPLAGDPSLEPTDWQPNCSAAGDRKGGAAIGQRAAAGLPSDPAHRQGYAKLLSECSGSADGVRRVPADLGDDVPQHTGPVEAGVLEQPSAGLVRWDLLHAQALSKELLIKQNLQQWQQLNSDLDHISAWLDSVAPVLEGARTPQAPCSLAAIQERLRTLGNIQKELDKYKALVVSANLCSREFLQADSDEAWELQGKLHQVNCNWNSTSQGLQDCWGDLHQALLQSQDFQHTTRSLLLWLANCESRRGRLQPTDPALGVHSLTQHRKQLMELEEELLARQPQVLGLEEVSRQLLEDGQEPRELDAREQIRAVGSRVRLLLQDVAADLQSIDQRLDASSIMSVEELDFTVVPKASSPLRHPAGLREAPSVSAERAGEVTREQGLSGGRPFLSRVLRAALPLQLLLLLLLLLASLLPSQQHDYNCALANNFARSLYPMLRYTNGPPPT